MKAAFAAAFVAGLMQAAFAHAQSVTVEAGAAAGRSTDESVSVAAAQFRMFGDGPAGIRFFTEAAFGGTSDDDADAFGAAYPYSGKPVIMEAYAERIFGPKHAVLDVRAGRYRTPFGISSGSDQGYVGFLRAPLIRYDNYYALSNNFLEHGVDVMAGVPRFMVEASVGAPADVGTAKRRSGVDTVIRLQGFEGPFIVGLSRIWTRPYQDPSFADGQSVFTGIDVRWMHEGIQLRGEWLTGKPFDGTSTAGWYADAIIHHIGMGPVTVVARIERSDYDTPYTAFEMHAARQTLGAKIRIIDGLIVQLNALHQSGLPNYASTSFDAGVMYSVRRNVGRR